MNRIIIDGNRIKSKEEFFTAVQNQIGAKRLIGRNLDALYDVLTSLTVHTVIEIHSRQLLESALGEYWKRIFWVLSDCLDENRDLELKIES